MLSLRTFRKLRLYQMPLGYRFTDAKLSTSRFVPTAPTQDLSCGFVPPRSDEPGDYPLVETVAGFQVVRLMRESRSVPASAINAELATRCQKVEDVTGRKPGRKAKKDLREEVILDLLPKAFIRTSDVYALVEPSRGLLVIASASESRASELVGELVNACVTDESVAGGTSLSVAPLRTNETTQALMLRVLLSSEGEHGFSALTKCTLQTDRGDGAVQRVTYTNYTLADNEEIRNHLAHGEQPVSLAMSLDTHTTFELTAEGSVKDFAAQDDLATGTQLPDDKAPDAFDANVTLLGHSLTRLFDALVPAMGGLLLENDKQQSFL